MFTRRSTVAMLASAITLALTGCGAAVDAPETAGATRAPVAQNAKGRVRLVGDALGEVALRPEQRAEIEKLAADADARHATVDAAKQSAADALAAQVELGAIDRAALQPKVDALVAATAGARAADQAAIQRLHDLLDADQRGELVDAVRDRLDEKKAEHKGGKFARMHAMAEEIGLTDDQKARIYEVVSAKRSADKARGDKSRGDKSWRGGKGKIDGMLDSFESEEFTTSGQRTPDEIRAKVQKRSERILGTVEAVLPILTAEQRKLAAAKLRTMAKDARF
jgi:Spy/CpxP family protein refolding chaperone